MDDCNCGVYDVESLADNFLATNDDFDPKKFFLKKEEEWGGEISRFVPKYTTSSYIDDCDPGSLLRQKINSINSIYEDLGTRLREKIRTFLIDYEGLNNMLCVHMNRRDACMYYTKTLLEAVHLNCSTNWRVYKKEMALVVCSSPLNAKITCTDLYKGKKNGARVGVELLGNKSEEDAIIDALLSFRRTDIVVGSANDMLKRIEKVEKDGNGVPFKCSIKYIFVENSEEFASNREYLSQVSSILSKFLKTSVCVVFFAYAPAAKSLLSTRLYCEAMVKGDLFVEIEKLGCKELFDFIEIKCIPSKEELLDTVSAIYAEVNRTDLQPGTFAMTSEFMDPLLQKLVRCSSDIAEIKAERRKQNERKHQTRDEKILVFTSTTAIARLVTSYLTIYNKWNDITILTELDSVSRSEQVNFELRDTKFNIVVTDSKSLRDINRGIIDSVIFFDLPPKSCFQTVFEVEMERLISRESVKLKVYVYMDEKKDIWAYPKLRSLVKKYRKKVSQKFVSLKPKYRRYVEEIKEISEYETIC